MQVSKLFINLIKRKYMLFYLKLVKNIFLILLIFDVVTNYAWGFSEAVKMWNTEGLPVTVAPGHQLRSDSISDGTGGAFIFWEDSRISPDIYGQRITADGSTMWEENGTPFINALNINGVPAIQTNPEVISDGVGGAIITWEDNRFLQGDIFAQRIDVNGNVLWQDQGVPVCTACYKDGICANYKQSPRLISDGDEGAIITWFEVRDGYHFSVWAQRINSEGVPLWTINGVPILYESFYAMWPKIISDGNGGAIIVWQDQRDVNFHLYAQRINANGEIQWIANGVKISPPIGQTGLNGYSLIADENNGAIIVWVDRRLIDPTKANIYAQKVDFNGQIQWETDGVQISFRPGDQYDPKIVSDGVGGGIITWEDGGASPEGSGQQWIYAQRISATGEPLWTIDGIPIYTNHGFEPKIVSDKKGGAFIVWNGTIIVDPFFHIPSIFAQHINKNGHKFWSSEGFVVYGEPYGHYGHDPQAISDGDGGVIIHWTDYRHNDTYWDIYAQRLIDRPKSMPWIYLLLDD
jgi:hypothetical protein